MIQNRVTAYTSATSRRPLPPTPAKSDWSQFAQEQGPELARRLEQFLADHPKACLGIGLGMGVILGWLIKRR